MLRIMKAHAGDALIWTIAACSLVMVLFTAANVEAALRAHWTFDEGIGTTAADSSGNGFTGTLVGGVNWTEGKTGDAVTMDGSGGYVETGAGSFITDTAPFSIAFWMNSTIAGNNTYILGKSHPDGGQGFDIRLWDNSIRICRRQWMGVQYHQRSACHHGCLAPYRSCF